VSTATVPLWPHQEAAIMASLLALRAGHASGLVILPTGVGKTGFALSLARRLEVPALFLVHRDELVAQTAVAAGRFWPEAAVASIEAGTTDWDVPDLFRGGRRPDLCVGMVPSLVNRLETVATDRFGLVIADEAHLAVAPTWSRILDHFQPGFLLGLTATPERLDGRGLGKRFGREPVYYYPLRQAIDEGRLVKIEPRSVQTKHSLDAVESGDNGDLREGQLARAVNTDARNELVVRAYERFAGDRRAVAFCVDVDHAVFLAMKFQLHGIACEAITGGLGKQQRQQLLRDFAAGKLRVLTNCEVLTTGFDDPGISCILMARPTQSRALYIQSVGRGLRLAPDKTDCLLIDFVDNDKKHKLVCALDLLGKDRTALTPSDRAEPAEPGVRPDIEAEAPIVSWRLEASCPWPSMPTLEGYEPTAAWQGDPASAGQMRFLQKLGMRVGRDLTKGEASHLISRALEYEAAFPPPATTWQRRDLERAGLWQEGMSRRQAARLLADFRAAEGRANAAPQEPR
jgi:superfamily II DNA or RNA helicase